MKSKPLEIYAVLSTRVNALPAYDFERLQSGSGDELSVLMPSVLDKAFKAEL